MPEKRSGELLADANLPNPAAGVAVAPVFAPKLKPPLLMAEEEPKIDPEGAVAVLESAFGEFVAPKLNPEVVVPNTLPFWVAVVVVLEGKVNDEVVDEA